MENKSTNQPDRPDVERTPAFNMMQAVKRRFFAMRNGDLAAQMSAGGVNYKINFGLNLPQIREIATMTLDGSLPDYPHKLTDDERRDLAAMLWNNGTTRESRLIAPMLMRANEVTADEARLMLTQVATVEEADILCHRLLRNHQQAMQTALGVYNGADASPLQRYGALRLIMNLLQAPDAALNLPEIKELAAKEAQCPDSMATLLCRQIADEVDWLTANT